MGKSVLIQIANQIPAAVCRPCPGNHSALNPLLVTRRGMGCQDPEYLQVVFQVVFQVVLPKFGSCYCPPLFGCDEPGSDMPGYMHPTHGNNNYVRPLERQ